MELIQFVMINIACIVCGDEEGYPAVECGIEKFLAELTTLGWDVREYGEQTGPVCVTCIDQPEGTHRFGPLIKPST